METSYKHWLPAVEIHTTIYFWLPCMSSKNESNILVGAGDTQVLLGEATSCTTYHILSCHCGIDLTQTVHIPGVKFFPQVLFNVTF